MASCKHLKALFELCQAHQLKLSSSDLIRIFCPECGTEEVCPSVLWEHYEAKHPENEIAEADGPTPSVE